MRCSMFVAAALCAAWAATVSPALPAQSADTMSGPILTLDEAVSLATQNNPTYLSVVNDRRNATAARKAAYGALLPRLDASLSGIYQQQGGQPINGVQFAVGSDVLQSFYNLGLTYTLSWATFVNPKVQSASVRAADADITGSLQTIRNQVTQDYLTVLQDQAKAELQDTLIAQATLQLELAKAKLAVGSGTQLDVNKADVALGQAKVASLQARNQVEIDKLRLYQDIGVPEPANVRLTTAFTVQQPAFVLDSLLALARAQNPTLAALRTRTEVASLNVKSVHGEYLPSLQLSTGIAGYTYQYTNSEYPVQLVQQQLLQQQASCYTTDSIRIGAGLPSIGGQCAAYVFTPQMASQIRSANQQFPFGFTRTPWQVAATFSLPIFNNFTREQQIEQAEANRNDANYKVRAQELQLTADVTSAYLTLETQVQTVALQEQNASKAREELRLAQERYRVGAATYLDLADAQATYSQAENDRINAVYQYHKAFAALENAVGRPLR